MLSSRITTPGKTKTTCAKFDISYFRGRPDKRIFPHLLCSNSRSLIFCFNESIMLTIFRRLYKQMINNTYLKRNYLFYSFSYLKSATDKTIYVILLKFFKTFSADQIYKTSVKILFQCSWYTISISANQNLAVPYITFKSHLFFENMTVFWGLLPIKKQFLDFKDNFSNIWDILCRFSS